MKRALFVSAFGPALGSGRALRMYTVIRALAELGPLDLAYVNHGAEEPSPEYQAIASIDFHPIRPSRGARRAVAFAGQKLRAVPGDYARSYSPELVAAAEALAVAPGRGQVIGGDLNAFAAMRHLARRRPVAYNAHNIESSYNPSDRPSRVWERVALERFETRALRIASESWMVSRLDMERARKLAPGAKLRYVPNVVDVAAITPVAPRARRDTVLMIGDFSYPPNRLGLAMLAGEVMPLVWREMPGARLRVVGRGLDAATYPEERIEVAGFVDSLASAYAEADVVAVPLTESGGTPLKFVEALAYGMPVVATPLAAAGLDSQAGEHHLEGPDPATFAARILDVLRDGAPELAARGRRLAEEQYSVETLVRLLAA